MKPDAAAVVPVRAVSPHPGRQKVKDALLALSLANLLFMNAWFASLFDEDFGFFNKLPVTSLTLGALVANLFLCTLIFWLAGQWIRRSRNRVLKLLGHLALWFILVIPLDFVRFNLLHISDHSLVVFVRKPLVILAGLAVLGLLLRWHRQAVRGAALLIFMVFPLAGFTLGKTALLLLHVKELAQYEHKPPPMPPLTKSDRWPRVVWLLFDELEERTAFSGRPPGIQLPELDRLSRESLHASNAYSPGPTTLLSLPALTTGQMVSSAKPVSHSELRLTLRANGREVGWSTLPNVFSQARELGFNTALVGWYHPYSRILGPALNYCEWFPYPPFEPARRPAFAATMAYQIRSMVPAIHLRQLFVNVQRDTCAAALSLVTNTAYGLIFVHFPVPHKPGIYLPEKDQFTITGVPKIRSYLNNMILADHTLGRLRRAMEGAGLWERTWILVTSDHWWREANYYGGKVDHRIPFILKPAGSTQSIDYQGIFNTVVTKELLLAILRGEIKDLPMTVTLLDQHRLKAPPSYDSSNIED